MGFQHPPNAFAKTMASNLLPHKMHLPKPVFFDERIAFFDSPGLTCRRPGPPSRGARFLVAAETEVIRSVVGAQRDRTVVNPL